MSKKYDREKKKWVTGEEYDKRYKKRDSDICRGGKPHDYVLILPGYVTYTPSYRFNPEDYYKVMDELHDFEESQYEKLRQMGITSRYSSVFHPHKESRSYGCTVCKKLKYEFQK